MRSVQYTLFDEILIRSPLYPFDDYREKTQVASPLFREALVLSAPRYYEEYGKNKDKPKELYTLYKYYSRACSRATPFGIFACCSMGKCVNGASRLELVTEEEIRFSTRLDMHIIGSLIRYLEQIPILKGQLKYFPNNSIYYTGIHFRYIEAIYDGSKCKHNIVEIERDEYLDVLLDVARQGACIDELVKALENMGVPEEEVKAYIDSIIASQVLRSELEMKLTGGDLLLGLIENLNTKRDIGPVLSILNEIENIVREIPSRNPEYTQKQLERLTELFDRLNISYNKNYLLQVDSFRPCKKAEISHEIKKDVLNVLAFANKFAQMRSHPDLERFKRLFYQRYEDGFVPLAEVLDIEMGINLLQQNPNNDDIIKGIRIQTVTQGQAESIILNTYIQILLPKYIEVLQQRSSCIFLTDADCMTGEEARWDDLSVTSSVLCSILSDKEHERLIHIKIISGKSASSLIGRFGHLDKGIKDFYQKILTEEENAHPDCLVAEIIHLPEDRTGNILFRELTRRYEIPYLAASSLPQEFRISIDDILVGVVKNKVRLFSKRHNKEIIPYLSTAHNYQLSSNPVYYFLCLLQTQNMRNNFSLNYPSFFRVFNYLPRIMYGPCILEREKWKIGKGNIECWKKLDGDKLIYVAKAWRTESRVPELVLYCENDQELLVDFDDAVSLRMFLSHIRPGDIWVEEFLFDTASAPVRCGNKAFVNEVIFSCYKEAVHE